MAKKREVHFESKVINGIRFTSHDYQKGKYLISAEGYEGTRWVGYDTWEKRNDGDVTDGRSSFSPKNRRWFQASFTKKVIISKLTDLYPMPLLLVAPKTEYEVILGLKTHEDFEHMFFKYEKFKDEKIIKKVYRKYVKVYHPDMGGDNVAFKHLQCAYKNSLMHIKIKRFNKKDFIEKLKKQKTN